MKVIYKQIECNTDDPSLQIISPLVQLGIGGCHFKAVTPSGDQQSITPQLHHHTSCEMHLVTAGCEYYTAGGKQYTILPGQLLLIPPNTAHQHLRADPDTQKYAVTLSALSRKPTALAKHFSGKVIFTTLPTAATEILKQIQEEYDLHKEFSSGAIECQLFLLLLAVARATGFREEAIASEPESDLRVRMAQQYVLDNIDRPISCQELANYCHLSQKQLSRLFLQYTGKTPAAFIRSQKIVRIEYLLAETSMALKEISDLMHFTSECHFNSFFTKYGGMTPGAYRKMENYAKF